MGTITAEMFQAILPEVCLLLLAVIVLAVDLLVPDERKGVLPWLTALGLALTLVFSLLFGLPGSESTSVWGGMLRHDLIGFVFKMLFIFGALIVVLFSMDYEEFGKRGEYYVLMLISLMGMTLMSSAGDLIMLFLSIETTSIPLYVLSGFLTGDDKSTESGIKYLLFGSMTTAIMVYGFSLLYGFSGTTDLYKLAGAFADMPAIPLIGSILLILVGFAFKVSMAPFHFWAPDVYEGAPTPITAFLSTASKGAGFAVLLRVLLAAFPGVLADWSFLVSVGAALTMTVGNYIAMKQTNIKRLLAYSSIAHAGYMLIGVASASTLGVTSVVYYIIVYLLTNLAAFGIVIIASKTLGSDELEAYNGLSRRNPALAVLMLVAFLSLAGIPPMGGFIAKVLVFAAAVQADLVWLAFVGVINAIIGLYYYLIVLKRVYLYRSEGDEEPMKLPTTQTAALAVLIIGILAMGVIVAPWFQLTSSSALDLF